MNYKIGITAAIVTGLMTVMGAGNVFGRMVKIYTSKELKDMSMAIIIAEAIKSTNTDEINKEYGFLRGVTTRFRVLSVFKGEVNENEIEVLHWRYVESDIFDGPTVVRFLNQTHRITVQRNSRFSYSVSVRPTYLLYLTKANGRFCLSDSDLADAAARELMPPF